MSAEPRTYFEDPHFKMGRKFLSDETYAEAIESFVIVDADVLFINRTNKSVFLLARRKVKPMQGLWLIGGRIFAGEPERAAIARLVKRETSLSIAPDRFEYLCINRYLWTDREQEPQNKGSDNLCYTFALEVSDEEKQISSEHLDPDEYDTTTGLQEFDKKMLEAGSVHQAIRDLYDIVFDEKP